MPSSASLKVFGGEKLKRAITTQACGFAQKAYTYRTSSDIIPRNRLIFEFGTRIE